jgi:hypothetical protein
VQWHWLRDVVGRCVQCNDPLSHAARAAAARWWEAEGGLEQRPHRLQRWFATAVFLTLVPQSYSGRVLAASVRILLQLCIAWAIDNTMLML